MYWRDWSSDVCSSDLQFFPVKKVAGLTLIAEEEPVLAFGPERAAFLKKRSEWREAGARTNHDDWAVSVGRSEERRVGKERHSVWQVVYLSSHISIRGD